MLFGSYLPIQLLLLGAATAAPAPEPVPHHRVLDPETTTAAVTTIVQTVTVTVRLGADQTQAPSSVPVITARPTVPVSSAAPIPTSNIPVSALPEFTDPEQFQSMVLNSTNTYRVQHGAQPVVFNSTLAAFADDVTKACKMEHSGGPFGENLAIGCRDLDGCIELWGNERDLYDFDAGLFSKDTGHFSQLVWKSTTDVGCAARFCADNGSRGSWYLVCEYWPRGNVKGQFVEMVGKQVEGKSVTARSEASAGRGKVSKPALLGVLGWFVSKAMLT